MLYLLSFTFLLVSTPSLGQILPPPPAPKVVPPHTTLEEADRNFNKRRKKKSKKNKKTNETKKPPPPPVKNPWRTYSRIGLMLPYVITTGNFRSNYQVEPGMTFNLLQRWGDSHPYQSYTFWYGIRMAPFSGGGSYQDQNGRFNFFYWGPSFSFLKLSEPAPPISSGNTSAAQGRGSQHSWRWSLGLSAMIHSAYIDSEANPGQGDLGSKGLGIDIPGLWTEVTYGRIFGRSTSIDFTGGVQMGESKVFIYLSAGVGLWY